MIGGVVVVVSYDGPSVRPYFDKQEPSMNPCRMLELLHLPETHFRLVPGAKRWLGARAGKQEASS